MEPTSNSNFVDHRLVQHSLNEDDLVVLGSHLVDSTRSYASLPRQSSALTRPSEKVLTTGRQLANEKQKGQKKVRHWKRPDDKPKRAVSAYNLFFILERQRLLQGAEKQLYTVEVVAQTALHQRYNKPKRLHVKTHGLISFQDLSRTIAMEWKLLIPSQREIFVQQAKTEAQVYFEKIAEWKATKELQEEAKKPEEMSLLHHFGNQHSSERPSEYASVAVALAASLPDAHQEHHHHGRPENVSVGISSIEQYFSNHVPSTQVMYTNISPPYQQTGSPVTENVSATAALRTNSWDEVERGNRMLDMMVEGLLAENIDNEDNDGRTTNTVSTKRMA